MLPLRLELEGFLTYRERETLDFRDDWLWAITGKNGAGKSALFDAITFALYGEYRGGARSEERLIAHGCAALRVAFDFAVGGEAFRVERTIERRVGRTRISYAKTWRAYAIDWANPPNILSEVPETETAADLERWVANKTGLKHDAFCACVLLTQGEATKFITSPAGARQQVLMQLLDLRQYERLAAAAKARRDRLKGELDANEKSLKALEDVNREDKTAADAAVSALADEVARLDDLIEAQVIVRERATEFARLQGELTGKQEELAGARELLKDAQRIEAEAAERAALTTALPVLSEILCHRRNEARARAAERDLRDAVDELGLEALESERDRLRLAAQQAERARDAASAVADAARKVVEDLRPAAEAALELGQLAHAIEAAESELANLREALLDHAALKADVRAREAAAATAPLLRVVLSSREEASTAASEAAALEIALAQLRSDAEAARARATKLRSDETEARALANARRQAHATALAAAERDREDLAARVAAGQEAVCSRCGQRVDPAHVRREVDGLQERLGQHEREAQEADRHSSQAAAREAALQDEGRAAEESAAEAERAVRRAEDRRDACAKRRDQALDRAREAASKLPQDAQARCRRDRAYPGLDDVEGAERLAADLGDARERLAELDDAAVRASQVEGRLAEQQRRSQELRSRFGADVLETAVAQRAACDAEAGRLNTEADEASREALRVRDAAGAAEQALAEASTERERLLGEAAEQDALARAASSAAATLVRGLEPEWRGLAADEARLSDGLPLLADRLKELSGAEVRLAALGRARRSVDTLAEEVRVREAQLTSVPADHRVPVETADAQLAQLKEMRGDRQEEHRLRVIEAARIAEALDRAEGLRSQRTDLELRYEDATTLQKWFGRDGLQAVLVQEAQREIGRAANDYLSRISEGWLGLVFEATQDALEIRVTDLSSGDEPVDVALISGSQKFRVAVSVALAIGQYRGGASRDIRSVIIDEGFGSLDIDGRREMIEQLRGLGSVLERVILVSHQEEFQEAFANGYHIEKVNRTSRATRRGAAVGATAIQTA